MTVRTHRATTWPLLRKDLTEMAAQGRGYWLRMLAVALIFGAFYFGADGMGGLMFGGLNVIVSGLLAAIAPAVVASAIAGEKERNSFALLLITDLKPRELLLQKFMARLIPLLNLLFCLLPLYAVCYSQGGIEISDMVQSIALLILCVLQAGSVGLCCSCRFQTPAGALVAAWIFFGLAFLIAEALASIGTPREYAHILTGPYHLYQLGINLNFPTFSGKLSYGWRLLVMGGSTYTFLLMARYFLLRRAFPAPGSRRHRFVRWLHARLDWMKGRLRGGSMLPERDAFLWRELHRLGIATFRFKVRLAVAAFLASFAASLVVLLVELNGATEIYFGMHVGIWIIMAIATTIFGVSAAQAESKNRTEETLAVTPDGIALALSARMSALTILSLLLFPALLVLPGTGLLLLEYLLRPWTQALIQLAAYILPIAATFLVLPFFFLRYGMWFGTVFKGSARALAVAVIAALVWFIGAEYVGAKAYDYFEDMSYVLSPGGYNVGIRPESLRLLEWFESARGIASPAALPVKILQREDAVHPAITGVFTVFYWSLGMLLQHRTLRRVRKRYG